MCGRFLVIIDEAELKDIIASAETSADERLDHLSFTFRGGEIFPSNTAPVITADGVRFMTWGFPSIANKKPHINARSETAMTSKTFREAMTTRRCVVPASAYFEWQMHGAVKKRKTKYEFTLPKREPLYMAGIYTTEGQFAILTRDAAPAMTEIHDRMPVIIPKPSIEAWLKKSPEVMGDALTALQFEPVPASDKNPNQLRLFT